MVIIAILTLIVSSIACVVSIHAYRYTKKRDKKQREALLKRKKAQLDALEFASRMGISANEAGSIRANIEALRAEIDILSGLE